MLISSMKAKVKCLMSLKGENGLKVVGKLIDLSLKLMYNELIFY